VSSLRLSSADGQCEHISDSWPEQPCRWSVTNQDRCPWIIIKSAATLLSFLSAYAIFMAPMAGIIFCDYWLVKRKRYDVPALYNSKGIYLYKVRDKLRSIPAARLTEFCSMASTGELLSPC
jgi:hypothetical protein